MLVLSLLFVTYFVDVVVVVVCVCHRLHRYLFFVTTFVDIDVVFIIIVTIALNLVRG